MAKHIEWTDEQQKSWDDWVATRPEIIQRMARKHPPDRLYQMGKNRVTLHSYNEDGTVCVNVTGQYNRVVFSRQVFDVKPDDLVECDLPGPDEDLGDTAEEAGYSDADIKNILIPNLKRLKQGWIYGS